MTNPDDAPTFLPPSPVVPLAWALAEALGVEWGTALALVTATPSTQGEAA